MNHHDNAVTNQIEKPHFEVPKIEGTKSFFQIDQATAFQLLQELDATEFKVFLFLTLRAYGWDEKTRRVGDGVTRASGTFVAKGTSLSEATAERSIASLKQKGLISKLKHSCKWGNTYQVKPTLLRQIAEDKKELPKKAAIEPAKTPPPEEPKIEGTKIEAPQNHIPSSLKSTPLAASNCRTSIESRNVDLSLKVTFENYFSEFRAPMAEKKERAFWAQLQKRNPDVTEEEFLECLKLVSQAKDSKGKPITMKFLWMANGFDNILLEARQRIKSRNRQEELKQADSKAKEVAAVEQQTSPEEVRLAKEAIRALLGGSLLKPMNASPAPQPDMHQRQAFLLAQARQMEQIGTFVRL